MKLYAIDRGFFGVALLLAMSLWIPAGAAADAEARYLERAQEYRQAGDLKAAVIELKNAARLNLKNPQTRLRLGAVYLRLGQGPQAQKEYEQAQKLGIPAEQVVVPRARAMLMQGMYRELLKEIQPVPDLTEATRAAVHALRGEAQLARRDRQAAAEEFAKAVALDPEQIPALLGQARLQAMDGDNKKARQTLGRVLALDPNSAEGWTLRGDLERVEGRLPAAERAYTKAIESASLPEAVIAKRAQVRIAAKDYAGAEKDVASLRQRLGKPPAVLYLQGLLQYRQGDFAAARDSFQGVLARQPDNLKAVFFLGVSHYALEEYEQAVHQLGRFVRAHPDTLDALRILILARLELGDVEGARPLVERVLAARPNDAAIMSAWGNALVAAGDTEGQAYLDRAESLRLAGEQFQTALEHLGKGERELAVERLEKAVELAPRLLTADVLRIREYLQAKEYTKALEAARALQSKWPGSPHPLTLQGLAYLGTGDRQQAREFFLQAWQLAPGNPPAANALATLARQAGEPDAARGYYRQVLEHHPGHLPTLLAFAKLEAGQGNGEAYRDLLEEAVLLHPDSLPARLLLARLYLRSGDPEGALATLDDWLRGNPEDAAVLFVRANTYLALGRTEDAKNGFAEVVRLKPNSAVALNNLAWLLQDEDPERALEYAQRAAKVSPVPDVMDTLGVILLRQGQAGPALEALAKATEAKPQDPAIRFHHARALAANGRSKEAREVLEALLAGTSAFAERGEAESLLARLR